MGVIGTHDGCFHCDEVFAVYLLKQLPEFKDHTLLRTRDTNALDECDVVVDVGGVYDPELLRFDHHQKNFNVTWNSLFALKSWSVNLSSAGLVYAHFGRKLLDTLTNHELKEEVLERLFHKIYESFVLEIDGIDNGTTQTKSKLKYSVRSGICARVSRFNQWWNEPAKDSTSLFWEAVEYVGREFSDTVIYYAKCWLPAREIIYHAMKLRKSVDPSRTIIVLEKPCPWRSHLAMVEREERANTVVYPQPPHLSSHRSEPKYPPQILFVVLPSDHGTWLCQSVSNEQYQKRLGLPASWCSLTDEELCDISGISDCLFVHGSGHLGVNKTREGAIKMAKFVVREMEANELAHSLAHLSPPTFSRGRGRSNRGRGRLDTHL